MDSDFTAEARALLDAFLEDDLMVGYNEKRDVSRAAEALRAVAERAWAEGYEQAYENEHGPISNVTDGSNPYTKQNQGGIDG